MIEEIKNSSLRKIAEKVMAGSPADADDAGVMLSTPDVMELGMIADYIRRKINGDRAYYTINININYTNICELRCPLCAFSRDAGDPDAYLLLLDRIAERVKDAAGRGIDEVHIVGGLNPSLRLDYFTEMLRRIKSVDKKIFIVAFTAVEYDYFSRINNIPLEKIFTDLMAAGLGAVPGGGAEIFSDRVRGIISPKKISGKRWLDVMRTAHSLGLKTNATMLYNHIETNDDIISHMTEIRNLQDETGGFKTFVPLLFHEENTGIRSRRSESTGYDDIRLFAAARIFLQNIPHIKALWMYLGDRMAQTLLDFGVDDIGGTYINEKVVHSAGAKTPDYGSETHLRGLIENAGKNPVKTNAGYQ